MIVIGTSYFLNRYRANKYYNQYGYSAQDVEDKIEKGEIFIGKPPLNPGEVLILNPKEGRYFIQRELQPL